MIESVFLLIQMIRKVKPSDFDQLIQIINRNWNYELFGRSQRNSQLFSKLDLYKSLSISNYTSVYIKNKEIVGFLLANIPKSNFAENYTYLYRKIEEIEDELLESKEGKIFVNYDLLYKKVNKELLSSINYPNGPEIVLFAVDPSKKKQGIGSALLRHFYQFLKKQGYNRCYLFTDTTSDFEFYKHIGFTCLNEITQRAPLRHNNVIHFYLMESPKIIYKSRITHFPDRNYC